MSVGVRAGRTRAAAVAYGLYAAVAIAGWLLLPTGGFWINDSGAKYLQAEMIHTAGDGSSAIRLEFAPTETGGLLPQTAVYLRRVGHEFRIVLFPDYFARGAAVVWRVAGETGVGLLPLVAGLAAVGATVLAARLYVPGATAAWVPLVLLASPWMFYHWVFWEHTLALLVQAVSLLVMLGGLRTGRIGLLIGSGAVLGLGIFLRSELALLGVAMALGLAIGYRDWRWPAGFAVGLIPPSLVVVAINITQWGHPLGLVHENSALASQWIDEPRWRTMARLVVGMLDSPGLALMAIVGVLAAIGLSASRRKTLALGGLTLAAAAAVAVRVAFLGRADPFRALLSFGSVAALPPILMLGLALGWGWKASRQRRALAWASVLFVAGVSASCPSVSAAGIHWGPRMLLPTLLPMALLAAERLSVIWRMTRRATVMRWELGLVLATMVIGWIDTGYSWRLLHDQRAYNAAVERYLDTRPERLIATNLWWVPQVYARASSKHAFLVLERPGDYPRFLTFARAQGTSSWLLATSPATGLRPPAQRLSVPGAPERGSIVDVRFYRMTTPP